MKKMIITIAMGVLCLCVTSCSDIYEDAYMAEIFYRDAVKRNDAMELKYKQDFLNLWHSMTDDERIEYRNYRSYMESETEQMKKIEQEAIELLNE